MEHCGGVKHEGNFVHSLTLTDIHSGWTECAALVVREQTLVVEGISMIRYQLPFVLRGLDTDKQRRVHERDLTVLLSRAGVALDLLARLPQERPGLGRAEQWRGVSSFGRLRAAERSERSGDARAPLQSAPLYVNFFQPSFKQAA